MKVKSLSRVRHLATPWTAAYQAPPSMGFSRQEYWSGVPWPSPCVCAKLLQLSPTLCDAMDCSPPGSSVTDEENQLVVTSGERKRGMDKIGVGPLSSPHW